MCRILMLLCLFILSITPAIAQSDDVGAWSIIERCIGEPIVPPDDWSFEGIIFLYSYTAVHGLNNQIETPYVIAYRNEESFAYNGSISPDGRWFAVPTGHTEYGSETNSYYLIEAFHVYSTDGLRDSYIVGWNGTFVGGNIYAIPVVQWNSNTTFLYAATDFTLDREPYEFNPFTGEINLFEGFYQPLSGDLMWYAPHSSQISPDRQLWIATVYEGDTVTPLQLFDVANETATLATAPLSQSFFWQPDSSHFVTTVNQQTILLDRNGNEVDTIFDGYAYRFHWQPQGNDFVLTDAEGKLLIGDSTNRQLIDPCMMVKGFAWSPSGELAVSDEERISIINFEERTHYIAAYHEGSVFDWRMPPEDE